MTVNVCESSSLGTTFQRNSTSFSVGGKKPTYLTSATSVKAVSVVPSGSNKTDVHRENTDVRWVGFHPLFLSIVQKIHF